MSTGYNLRKKINLGFVGKDEQIPDLDKKKLLQYVTAQDLKSFGLIPELIGRIPVVTHLNPLDAPTLKRILTEPKNSIIKQYIKLFELDNIELNFDKGVFDFIVEKAMEYNLGARGLRSICEAILLDHMFDVPSKVVIEKLTIDLDYAKNAFEKSALKKLKVAS